MRIYIYWNAALIILLYHIELSHCNDRARFADACVDACCLKSLARIESFISYYSEREETVEYRQINIRVTHIYQLIPILFERADSIARIAIFFFHNNFTYSIVLNNKNPIKS